MRWFHKPFQPSKDCAVVKEACSTSSPCHPSPVQQPTTLFGQLHQQTDLDKKQSSKKPSNFQMGVFLDSYDCSCCPTKWRGGRTGWSHLLWWLQSHQLVKLVRKLVLWGSLTKFTSLRKHLQSLLTSFIVYGIVAVWVILSGTRAFWMVSKLLLFCDICRGAVSVPVKDIQVNGSLQKRCEPPNDRDLIFSVRNTNRSN